MLGSRLWPVEKPDFETARPSWQRRGLCVDNPSANWFPELGQSTAPAKAICRVCPVIDECLAYALQQGSHLAGIWAATSPRERRRMRLVVSQSGREATPTPGE